MKANPAWVIRKKRMKIWARANGVAIPSGLRMTPYCGGSCRTLIRRIQLKAFGASRADGKWRDDIRQLVTPRLTSRVKAKNIAVKERGIREVPANSNSGPRVTEYQSATGAYNAPWCASFVAWAYKGADRPLAGFNTAYVPSYVVTARAGKSGLSVVSAPSVVPGDLACYDWQGDGECDHIGIVTKPVTAGGDFEAIEGNTSVGNNSNGGEVMIRRRNSNSVRCFIRVSNRI